MKVTVYLGANTGDDPAFVDAARAVGRWIASNQHELVYGGSKVGLMGILADTVLSHGGKVHGIIPQFLKDREIAHENLTTLTIVETMAERKTAMLEQGDLFIALPGGLGTLEEMTEAIAAARVGTLTKPCVLYSVKGFYQPLEAMLQSMVAHDFLEVQTADKFLFMRELSELEPFVATYQPPTLRTYR